MRHARSFLSFLAPPREQPDLFDHSEFTATISLRPVSYSDHDLFDGGPPTGLQTRIGLIRPGHPNLALRAAIAVAAGWLPLAIMTALQSTTLHDGSFGSFLSDFSVHARSLIAVPLLILAEALCLPRLSAIAEHFREAGFIAPQDVPAFRKAVASTRRLRDSMRLEIAVLALGIILIVMAEFTVPKHLFPLWHQLRIGQSAVYSPAGWWHDYVSVWILLALVLGWLWRLVLWTRFLFLMSRLKLRLIAAHPDRTGGLKFVGISVQALSTFAIAISVIVAGTVANRVMNDGASILSFRYIVPGYAIALTALLVGPLTVFAWQLLDVWRRGVFAYGSLARSVGVDMERKWLNHTTDVTALDTGNFSATTDLYSIVSNVYGMGVMPVSLTNIAVLIVSILLPFVPVVLLSVSPEVILQKLTGILL